MKKTLLYTAMTALILGSVTPSFADGHGDHGHKAEKKFEKIDTNSDGVISKAEHTAHADSRFAKMDADGDGQVTKEEAKAYKHNKKALKKE